MANQHRPVTLIILDGWGYRDEKDNNAILGANTPVWDRLWQEYPHTLISGCGTDVGLPAGQMGNSEVGHLNMGAGRVVYQEFTRITQAIDDGEFFKNDVLVDLIENTQSNNGAIHILGLLSPGGVHSHENHIHAMIKLAADRGIKRIYLHGFLDGRDTPPRSALGSIESVNHLFHQLGIGKIASLTGRYYAMDRDIRWDRVQQAYDLLTLGKAHYSAASALEALNNAYDRDEGDEFVKTTAIHGLDEPPITINDHDGVVFMNYRADRARQLTHAFTDEYFDGFKRAVIPNLSGFVTLTEYAANIKAPSAYPPVAIHNSFGEYISDLNLHQLRIAETEKYAHVTFFFNGGREAPYPGEERILVLSPKVPTYDVQPEMSAKEVTDKLVESITSERFDAIICNFANPDMVGHTGNYDATVTAIETIDTCLGRIKEALDKVNGEMIITADHGNAELMKNPQTGQAHTAHTTELVPLLYVGRPAKVINDQGVLSDIAPTLLHLLGVPQPPEMTGTPILKIL